MKKIFICAAMLALSGAPVFAQPNGDRGQEHQGERGSLRPGGAHPGGNANHGTPGGGGPQGHAATPQATPHPAPTPAPQANTATPNYNQHGRDNRSNGNGANGNRNDNNRPGGNNNGGNFGGGNSGPGNAMRGPGRDRNNSFGNAPRRAANFNQYQRNFTSPRRYRAPQRYVRPQGWYSHRWSYGERLPPAFFVRNYWIDDFFDYGLVNPPYGTTWVRYGADALLIDEESGEVIQVAYGVFY